MRKKLILSSAFILSLTSATSAMASDGMTVKLNNVEMLLPQESKVENGQLFVPLRWAAEQLGAKITWNAQEQEAEIKIPDQKNLQAQINSLMNAVSSSDPKEVVNTWIQGVKKRSGALQYAVMSPELQSAIYQDLAQNFWVTGGSSPRITHEQLQEEKITDNQMKYTLTYDLKDSSGIVGIGNRTITVEKDSAGYWWLKAITTTDKSDVWLSPGVQVIHQLGYKDSSFAFSEQEASQLVAQARHHFWNLSSGGALDFPPVGSGVVEEFSIEGKEYPYRWMVEGVNTKEKYLAYLEEIYTKEKAEEFWNQQVKSDSIVEVNGRLAQPNADGGSLANWEKAKVTLLEDNGPQKSYKFEVPIGETEEIQTHLVKFQYVSGIGWRVDQEVKEIR